MADNGGPRRGGAKEGASKGKLGVSPAEGANSNAPMLQCSNAPMLQCSNAPMLQCSNAPMLSSLTPSSAREGARGQCLLACQFMLAPLTPFRSQGQVAWPGHVPARLLYIQPAEGTNDKRSFVLGMCLSENLFHFFFFFASPFGAECPRRLLPPSVRSSGAHRPPQPPPPPRVGRGEQRRRVQGSRRHGVGDRG